jgi:hypothetical protein
MESVSKILGTEAELKRLAETKLKGEKKVRGLGLRERLQPEEDADRERTVIESPPQPTIMINMPAQGAGAGNDIATLARGIVEAPSYRRRAMLEAACERFSKDARNLDEAKALVAKLDEEIARIESKSTVMDRVRARTNRRSAT